MNKVLEKAKKNNKGFSLVELIVVVLIMAIIAVALAPQVMKWVGTSKDSADKNNAATIKSAVAVAVADYQQTYKDIPAVKFTVSSGLPLVSPASATTEITHLKDLIIEVLNGDYPTKNDAAKTPFTIEIATSGAIEVN